MTASAVTALTAQLGRFIADMPARTLPAQAATTIRRGVADTVGVALASVAEPVMVHARGLITQTPTGQARLWVSPCSYASRFFATVMGPTIGPQIRPPIWRRRFPQIPGGSD